jgi:hypothetical protein
MNLNAASIAVNEVCDQKRAVRFDRRDDWLTVAIVVAGPFGCRIVAITPISCPARPGFDNDPARGSVAEPMIRPTWVDVSPSLIRTGGRWRSPAERSKHRHPKKIGP